MLITIAAKAAFAPQFTGVEVYTFQLIRHLFQVASPEDQFILYTDRVPVVPLGDFFKVQIPENFQIKVLSFPRLWTQARLGWELLVGKPQVFFTTCHVLPLSAPPGSVVTIHDLTFEKLPQMYSPWHLRYLRWVTQSAVKRAQNIIVPSESTRQDLIDYYQIAPSKARVIYHGPGLVAEAFSPEKEIRIRLPEKDYILFLGRLEVKKNLGTLFQAFGQLKAVFEKPLKLVLAGPRGFGFAQIWSQAKSSGLIEDIIIFPALTDGQKTALLKKASILVLPSLYEGFGMPVLEAQSLGVPVVTSNVSSLPEITGTGGVLVPPEEPEKMAEAFLKILSFRKFRHFLIKKGFDNVRRFSWKKCALETLKTLKNTA